MFRLRRFGPDASAAVSSEVRSPLELDDQLGLDHKPTRGAAGHGRYQAFGRGSFSASTGDAMAILAQCVP